MRKYIIVSIAVMMYAPQAYAAAVDTALTNTLKGFNATKNVSMQYTKGCSASAGSQCWSAIASHGSGDKQFWTSNAYGGLAFKTVTPGSSITAPTAPSTATDSAIKDTTFAQM